MRSGIASGGCLVLRAGEQCGLGASHKPNSVVDAAVFAEVYIVPPWCSLF